MLLLWDICCSFHLETFPLKPGWFTSSPSPFRLNDTIVVRPSLPVQFKITILTHLSISNPLSYVFLLSIYHLLLYYVIYSLGFLKKLCFIPLEKLFFFVDISLRVSVTVLKHYGCLNICWRNEYTFLKMLLVLQELERLEDPLCPFLSLVFLGY